ncbi:hypothetical protein QTP88_018831 [Uroleucon formosanum]
MDLDNSLNNSCDKYGTDHAIVVNDHSPSNVNSMPNNINLTYTPSEQLNSHGRDSNLIKFSDNFTGVPYIIIEAISDNNNVGKLHPMKVGNLYFNKFNGILRIDPIANDVKESRNSDIILSDETFPNINESHWNCRSLRARLNDFSVMLAENKYQYALLSETWLLPNSSISIPNYHFSRQDRLDGYGIKIIINDKILDLWSIYVLLSSDPFSETFNNVFSLMNRSSLIGGDFNGHHPVEGFSISYFRGNLINSTILDYSLWVLNNSEATRINRPPYPDIMVDLSISSPNISLSCSWSVLSDPFGSHHLPILISIPIRSSYSNSSYNNNNTSTRFNFYATDWNQLTYQVVSFLESFTLECSPLNNYNNFVNKASGMNELDKKMDDWDETRVEKKIRIKRYIAKRRKKREK